MARSITDGLDLRPTTRRPARSRRRYVVAAAVLVVLWAWLGGWSAVVLGSDSMAPWATTGTLLVQHDRAPGDIVVGDVVSVRRHDGALVTHRVAEIEPADATALAEATDVLGVDVEVVESDAFLDAVVVRLRGDASGEPDPQRHLLVDDTPVVVLRVPLLGTVLTEHGGLLWTALLLLLVGVVAVRTRRAQLADLPPLRTVVAPTSTDPVDEDVLSGDVTVVTRTPTPLFGGEVEPPADPRVEALLATVEELAETGIAPVVLRDLVRVRVGELLALPSVELSGAVRALDHPGQFYVLALVDADEVALRSVPVESTRRRAGSDAVGRWWSTVDAAVPVAVLATVDTWLTAVDPHG